MRFSSNDVADSDDAAGTDAILVTPHGSRTDSLFEPAPHIPPPPHTHPGETPAVWIQDDDGHWYEGMLWSWDWNGDSWHGYVDVWVGKHHRIGYVPQGRIRRRQDGPRA